MMKHDWSKDPGFWGSITHIAIIFRKHPPTKKDALRIYSTCKVAYGNSRFAMNVISCLLGLEKPKTKKVASYMKKVKRTVKELYGT